MVPLLIILSAILVMGAIAFILVYQDEHPKKAENK